MTDKINGAASTEAARHSSSSVQRRAAAPQISQDILQQIRQLPVASRPQFLARQLCSEVLRKRFGLSDQTSPQYQRLLSLLSTELMQSTDFADLLSQHHQLMTTE